MLDAPANEGPRPTAPSNAGAETPAGLELILQQVDSLPTIAPIGMRVMAVASAADADYDVAVRFIESDPTLTARVLSLCRRASSGISHEITTVRRAVVMLGWETVQCALLSVQVYEVMKQAQQAPERREEAAEPVAATGAPRPFDRVGFWKHSIGVAACAELLAETHRSLGVNPGEAFVAGLVHDLGKLALDWILPKSYGRVLALAEARGISAGQAERAVIGLDHQVAGKRLAEHWSLPHVLQDVMWLHGQPAASLPELAHRRVIMLVTAADALCRGMHVGWSGCASNAPGIESICEEAGLRETQVRGVLSSLHVAVAQRCADLGLEETSGPELVLASISAANDRLARLHQACRTRAATARTQSKALEAIARFAQGARPGASVGEVIERVAGGFVQLAGPGFVAVIFQAREGEPWRLSRFRPDGAAEASEAIEPPKDESGRSITLASMTQGSSMGGTIGLVTWLSEHVSGPGAPDVRRLRIVPMISSLGPAALLVHDRELAAVSLPDKVMEALVATWAGAIASAAQHDGARRINEALARTTRELAETQNRLAETQSLARLGELTAGAAHELNNPLTVICGRAQILAQTLSDERHREGAHEIATAAERLSGLISALHFVARPPALSAKPTNLTDLLAGVISKARERARESVKDSSRVTLPAVRLITTSELALAKLDSELFGRALVEVLTNALESGPTAAVEVRVGVEEALAGRDQLVIAIRDDGRGMSPHALAHAFDPFFSEKPAGRQTGLGLTIARRLIGLHGGDIRLSGGSAGTSRGVTATICLPNWRWTGATEAPSRQAA